MVELLFNSATKLLLITLGSLFYITKGVVGVLMTVAVLPAILFMTPVYWVYGLVTKKEIVNE